MFTIKERALVLQDRIKELVKYAKEDEENTEASKQFEIPHHSYEDNLFNSMKRVKELVDDMSNQIEEREKIVLKERKDNEEKF